MGRFDSSPLTTDGGALLLRQVDRKIGLLKRLVDGFRDARQPERRLVNWLSLGLPSLT
ncbi:MAG: hypothetical protein HYR59_07010 [Acidobacteria bacterium]|nr:hypothetical protein [Acidobacteriota bacterium]